MASPMAEVFPQLAHGEHDAEGEDVVDLDLRQRRLVTNGRCFDGATIEDAVDAADEALQGRVVELVGASEACTTRASDRLASAFQTFSEAVAESAVAMTLTCGSGAVGA